MVGFPAKGVLMCSLVLALWVSYAAAQVKREGVPVIEIDTPIYDFGQVTEGEILTHDFRVFNRGAAPLEIRSVKTG